MINFSRSVSLSGALLVALAATACQKSHESPSPETNQSSAAQVKPIPTRDDIVREAVTTELLKDKHIDPSGIHLTATNGIVELTGQVDNRLSKDRATRIAEAVRGVRAVSNRLSVVAPKRSDTDIAADVTKALAYNAATSKLPIQVSVKDAVVTLTGTVRSWQEQQLAERIVDGVRGVRAAQDELATKSSAKRDSALIAADVKSILSWDVRVEHDPIEVAVKDGKVTLSGIAGSAAEKSRVLVDARVDGVKEIDGTGIEVKEWNRPDQNIRVQTPRSDQQIVKAIRDAAFYDPRVESTNINPSVRNGVATLTGTVETLQAKRAAEELARDTVGVVSVKNELVARPHQPLSDALLQIHIRDALIFDPLTDPRDIHVTVKNGHVTLTGSVGTFFERAEALDLVSRIANVTAVDDNLQVRDQTVPYVHSIWVDPYMPYADAWYFLATRPFGSDSTIEQRIKAEYSWSPFILPEDVHVKVENGKATLTGTVRSYLERRAAADDAIEAGAVAVDNQLKVG